MIIALDTETVGIDHFHDGATPFFLTTCDEEGNQRYWEWDVDPLTRHVDIPPEDVSEISELIRDADLLVGQNFGFDYKAMKCTNPDFVKYWDWGKVRDTLLAGHLLASNHPHNLTDMAIEYLGINIEPLEIKLKEACQEARRYCRSKLKDWRIAKAGLPEMPSAKSDKKSKQKGQEDQSPWKMDTWLPKAILLHRQKLIQTDSEWQRLLAPANIKQTEKSLSKHLLAIDEWFPYTGECRVINHRHEPCDTRIDRSSKWGNPFTHLPLHQTTAKWKVDSRTEAVERYKQWILEQPNLLHSLWELDGKVLGCCCKSKPPTSLGAVMEDLPCHGDVLAELLTKKRHTWWDVLEQYANKDSETTLALWFVMEKEIRKRKLEKIYSTRLKLLPITVEMEATGTTLSGQRLEDLSAQYQEGSETAKNVCVNIARSLGYNLQMPRGATPNQSLRTFMFDVLKVPPVYNKKAKTDAPTLNSTAMKSYLGTLPQNSKALTFVKTLLGKRSQDTARIYMQGYKRFWKPLVLNGKEVEDWYVLHPSLNPTGTDTLRWSSSNPNSQNISRKELFNLRYCFGPQPDREWWSIDYSNLELTLPAYKSGEQDMISLFEKENDPPYFGSNHFLVAHILYPELFESCINEEGEIDGRVFKKKYPRLYTDIKSGNFAVTYGSIAESGTADKAYGIVGAQKIVERRFTKIKQLNDTQIRLAEKNGYVETMPDNTVDPERGYPIICTRTDFGRVLPTTPLNYYIQSTACWVMMKAMIRVHEYHQTLGTGYKMVMQIHDEMVLSYPAKKDHGNLPIVQKVAALMRQSGDDIGIPLKVNIEFHPNNWSVGVRM